MVMPYHLHMPSYFLETFTEYPYHCGDKKKGDASYATAGAGVEYAGVRLDFAWLFAGHEYLARNTFWVSLGYSF